MLLSIYFELNKFECRSYSHADEQVRLAIEAHTARLEAKFAAQLAERDQLAAAQLAAAQLAAQQNAKIAELMATVSSSSSASAASHASASPSAQSFSDLEESRKAFSSPFMIDDNDVPERLFEHLKQAAVPANVNYVALVQGSGHGKTRSIIETCRQYGVLSVYMCFRDEDSTGFPVRGSHVGDVLKVMHAESMDPITKFLGCMLAAIEKRLLSFDWSTEQFDFLPFGLDKSFGIDDSFWQDALTCQDCEAHGAFSTERLKTILRHIKSKFADENLKLVFIWDEARALVYRPGSDQIESKKVSAFRLLRRVILERPFQHTVSVLLDTSSMVSNFLPESRTDPSSRFFQRKFLPPFIHVGQSNTALMRRVGSVTKEAVPEPFTRESLLELHGRALWFSYRSVGTPVHSLILTARDKFNAQSLSYGGKDARLMAASMAAACGIAASVAQLDIAPISSLASDMVHSHLATLIAVSGDRGATLVGYPSEPVVARAALSFLNFRAAECPLVLGEVTRALSHGLTLTTAGAAGEFVSRMFLLLHRDIPHNDMSTIVPKETLSHFLESLTGMMIRNCRICSIFRLY